jgi:hypothetical protein
MFCWAVDSCLADPKVPVDTELQNPRSSLQNPITGYNFQSAQLISYNDSISFELASILFHNYAFPINISFFMI